MTFETAFKKLKEKFVNVDASLLEDMAIQITISDEDCGGTFYAQVKDHVLAVEPYDYKDNDAIIDVTRAALERGVMLFAPVGPGCTIKVCPPLTIDEEALKEGLAAFREAVEVTYAEYYGK